MLPKTVTSPLEKGESKMKISNAERFREDIYTALKDSATWDWKVETPSVIFKGNHDEYKDSMRDYTQGKMVDGKYIITSLAHPMRITNKETMKDVILTIDEDGANFYKSEQDRFDYNGCVEVDWHKNRLSFAMHLVRVIAERLN